MAKKKNKAKIVKLLDHFTSENVLLNDLKFEEVSRISSGSGSVGNDIVISVYLDNGVVYEYNVADPISAREHLDAIVKTGYRHCKDGMLIHFPPHRISKVKAKGPGIATSYPDRQRGT